MSQDIFPLDHGNDGSLGHLPLDHGHAAGGPQNLGNEIEQIIHDLENTEGIGDFVRDIESIIDEITGHIPPSPPDPHLVAPDLHLPPIAPDLSVPEGTGTSVPVDVPRVGPDDSGHWPSWSIDPETGVPTFAPDPASFGLPLSTSDPNTPGS
jgi:hypothetical protein